MELGPRRGLEFPLEVGDPPVGRMFHADEDQAVRDLGVVQPAAAAESGGHDWIARATPGAEPDRRVEGGSPMNPQPAPAPAAPSHTSSVSEKVVRTCPGGDQYAFCASVRT